METKVCCGKANLATRLESLMQATAGQAQCSFLLLKVIEPAHTAFWGAPLQGQHKGCRRACSIPLRLASNSGVYAKNHPKKEEEEEEGQCFPEVHLDLIQMIYHTQRMLDSDHRSLKAQTCTPPARPLPLDHPNEKQALRLWFFEAKASWSPTSSSPFASKPH